VLHVASTTDASGNFVVRGSGDLGGTADAFHFVQQSKTGDGTIVARIVSQENTDANAKAGIAIRGGLDAGAAEVALVLSPGNVLNLMTRSTSGASLTSTSHTGSAPLWLQLARSGTTVAAATSSDGATWTPIGSVTVALSNVAYVGVVSASHLTSRISNVLVSNLHAN
jgi:regulation of enolase protein 1 (concanavalin A-like superfamily)